MLGILLAGGTGSRLGPVTSVISKQLLPIYDKPMIYYPLSLLMASQINKIVIITTLRDQSSYEQLLGNGNQWGITIFYRVQDAPNGLPDAFLLTEDLIDVDGCTMLLGDNLFYGSKMGAKLLSNRGKLGATVYGYLVNDVSPFGTFELSKDSKITNLIEKPINGGKGYAIPGIYHFDSNVSHLSKLLKPSRRGELEIIDLLKLYLDQEILYYSILDRGTAWLDTGTTQDLASASELIRVVQTRQGMLIGSPEEVAFRNNWIDKTQLFEIGKKLEKSQYGKSLLSICEE